VIDAGTSWLKVFIFDKDLRIRDQIKIKNKTFSNKLGWKEQNPTNIYLDILSAIKKISQNYNVVAAGITNQRETTVLWDVNTGVAAYPAITWEDERVKMDDLFFVENYLPKNKLKELTGLELSPIYSAAKIKWILENESGTRELLDRGRLVFGNINSWLIFNLTREQNHFTDHTNVSHTLLYSLKENNWSKNLLRIFRLDERILPEIKPNFYNFGQIELKDKTIPLLVSIADQQSSLYWAMHNENQKTNAKLTIGTGIFLNYFLDKHIILQKDCETVVAYYKKLATYMLEYRARLTGAELIEALRSDDRNVIDNFLRIMKEKIKELKIDQLIVDGGGVRPDELGNKLVSELMSLPTEIVRLKNYEATAFGVAQILKDNFK
jgi:glycerol kinase